jgi:transcriptional regulator with XRE-family HTH domain
MSAIVESLREELQDPEYSEGYAESFLDSYIATQIKVLREQAGLSQQGLAELVGTRQGVISRVENVNYSKWNISTLKKLARAFHVRLKVSFETYGSLLADAATFSREALQREPRESDSILHATVPIISTVGPAKVSHRRKHNLRPQLRPMNCPTEFTDRNRTYGAAAQLHLGDNSTMAEMAQRQ